MEWMEKFSIEKIRKKQEIKEKTSIAEGYKKTTQIQMTNAVELRLESSNNSCSRKIINIHERITLATGLYTRQPFASEPLRVSHYGVAGMT